MSVCLSLGRVLLPVLVLTACAAYDEAQDVQPPAETSDTGRVCIYRMAPRQTPGVWQDWVLDGRWSGQIRPDRYYCLKTPVGRHIVRTGGSKNRLEFTLDKDQDAFIRFDADPSFWGSFLPVLVDRPRAREELKSKGFDIDLPPVEP